MGKKRSGAPAPQVPETLAAEFTAAWRIVMRELRDACDIDYPEAARRARLCPRCVQNLETGPDAPKQETLQRLCWAYRVPFSVAALLVDLRQEGLRVPIKRVFRIWRAIRRFAAP